MNTPSHDTKYRADIDGLRAVAILPVLLFHAFPSRLSGGFVGVDVFFVISGFLISSIIFRHIKDESFSFLDFYARRVRRLFPALSLVLCATLIFGWFSLDADEFKMLGGHIAAGAGFVQNFVLWGEVGYFDVSSELKPLLHLWSLAIEEQYYLLFPLVVWVAWRIRVNLLSLVLFIAILSFSANLISVRSDPLTTFYFPHTRVWELMAGAILAAVSRSVGIKQALTSSSTTPAVVHYFNVALSNVAQRIGTFCKSCAKIIGLNRSLLSFIGFGLIAASTLVFDKGHHFPGWRALVPVLGTLMIIYAGQHAWINRYVLANKAVVFIGLISYPLYLWHWPLLSFARIIESELLSASIRLSLLTLSFVLATLTYVLIEKPARAGNYQRAWATGLIVAMLVIASLGWMAHQRELTSRVGEAVQEIKKWESKRPSLEDHCAEYFPEWNKIRDSFKCLFLEKSKPVISVIGDSHSRRIHYGISYHLGKDHNIGLFPMGCAMPFYDISVGIPASTRRGNYSYHRTKRINSALDFSIDDPDVKLIVLTTAACWNNIVDIADLKERNPARIVERKMRYTFEKLSESGKQILYVHDNPLLNFNPKLCVSRPFRINSKSKEGSCKITRKLYEGQRVQYLRIANRVLKDFPNIKVFDVASTLCDQEYCYASIDNKLLYHDSSHLSYEGSKYVGQYMAPVIKDLLKESQ